MEKSVYYKFIKKKVFIKARGDIRGDRHYSGVITQIDEHIDDIGRETITITILDKFNKLVLLRDSEILLIEEYKERREE